jgi:hypothetical protein
VAASAAAVVAAAAAVPAAAAAATRSAAIDDTAQRSRFDAEVIAQANSPRVQYFYFNVGKIDQYYYIPCFTVYLPWPWASHSGWRVQLKVFAVKVECGSRGGLVPDAAE